MSKNVNCLEGRRCPKCKQEDKLLVVAKTWVAVTDDGTDAQDRAIQDQSVEYDDPDHACCPECGWHGTWGQCSIEVQNRKAGKK